ncbi:EamA family transporter [Candidatus Bipolaricaulota bacterium]
MDPADWLSSEELAWREAYNVGLVAAWLCLGSSWLLKRIGAVRSGLLIPFSTVIAAVLGILVLNEAFTWRTAVGGLLVILGFWPHRAPPRHRTERSRPTSHRGRQGHAPLSPTTFQGSSSCPQACPAAEEA